MKDIEYTSHNPQVKWKRLENNDFPLPAYQSVGAAGFDLQAFTNGRTIPIHPGEKRIIRTGFAIAIPDGVELQIRPRSGIAIKNEIIILNSPGTIDCDYRGEIMLGFKNLSEETFKVEHGMRVAQGVFALVYKFQFVEVDDLTETERGTGGFGSTGV